MVVVRAWIILARSAVDGLAIGKDVEAVEAVGEAEVDGEVAVGLEALGFSVRSLNQVMEVPGFLPGYHSRGEIKNSRERD